MNNSRIYDRFRPTHTYPSGKSLNGPLLEIKLRQSIERDWSDVLTIREAVLMLRIIDMTVGWELETFTCSAQSMADGTVAHPRCRYPKLNMSRRSIFRALDRLKELGLLEAERKQNGVRLKPVIAVLMRSLEAGWSPGDYRSSP